MARESRRAFLRRARTFSPASRALEVSAHERFAALSTALCSALAAFVSRLHDAHRARATTQCNAALHCCHVNARRLFRVTRSGANARARKLAKSSRDLVERARSLETRRASARAACGGPSPACCITVASRAPVATSALDAEESKRATPRSTRNSYIDIPKSTSKTAAAAGGSLTRCAARLAAKPLQKAAVCGEAPRATKVTAVLASGKLATFPHCVFVQNSDRGAFAKPHAPTTRRTSTHRSSTAIKSRAHGFA